MDAGKTKMKNRPPLKHPLLEAAKKRPLTVEEQEELQRTLGISPQQLPLSARGGLLGIWGQTKQE